jgi:hypothetical protein
MLGFGFAVALSHSQSAFAWHSKAEGSQQDSHAPHVSNA